MQLAGLPSGGPVFLEGGEMSIDEAIKHNCKQHAEQIARRAVRAANSALNAELGEFFHTTFSVPDGLDAEIAKAIIPEVTRAAYSRLSKLALEGL